MNAETEQILVEIRARQANPLNTMCVRCRGYIYPKSQHVCAVVMRERGREAPGWA